MSSSGIHCAPGSTVAAKVANLPGSGPEVVDAFLSGAIMLY